MIPPFLGDQFDTCWGLVRAFYPDAPEAAYQKPELFIRVQRPRAGDLVMLKNDTHCGIYWQGGLLHQSCHTQGVVYEHKFSGKYGKPTFYRPTIDSRVKLSA